jgi:hypothetical protein
MQHLKSLTARIADRKSVMPVKTGIQVAYGTGKNEPDSGFRRESILSTDEGPERRKRKFASRIK